jgi:DNA primase
LKERGLTDETIATFGLGFCQKGILAGHVAIPIHNVKGELVAYAGRWPGVPPNPDEKYKLPKGFMKSWEVFNLHRARQVRDEHPLLIVEGFFDAIKLHQHGWRQSRRLDGQFHVSGSGGADSEAHQW